MRRDYSTLACGHVNSLMKRSRHLNDSQSKSLSCNLPHAGPSARTHVLGLRYECEWNLPIVLMHD